MRLIHALALVGLAVLIPVSNPGCSKYGEGAICDPLNNDPQTNISNDCDDGLVCTPGLCTDTAICCPPPGHAVTSLACNGMLTNCGTGGGNAGGMNPGTSVGGFGGSGGAGGAGGGGGAGGSVNNLCPHDECHIGAQLDPSCTACVGTTCSADPSCCDHGWDVFCVNKVESVCMLKISDLVASKVCKPVGGTGGGGGGTGGTPTGSGGAGGTSSSTGP